MDATTPDVRVISISEIRENPVALRAVNRESEDYIGLLDAVKAVGVLSSIVVRERTETIDDQTVTYFEIIDGLHRYTAACDANLKVIPVQVKSLSEAQVLEAQIMANVHKIETKPVEYMKQLQRIFAANPTLTLAEMAVKVAKSPGWISLRLGLLKLEKTLQEAVDDGKITVSNAVQLAKLPPDEQVNYVEQASTMDASEFVPLVQTRVKELKDAAREGREAKSDVFVPTARLQKMSALKAELDTPTVGPSLCKSVRVKDGPGGFALGVAWTLNMDPSSVEVRKADAEAKKSALDDAKKKRAAERAKKRANEATALAAKAAEAVNTPG